MKKGKYGNDCYHIDTGVWKKYGQGTDGEAAPKKKNLGNKYGLGPNPEPRAENKDYPSKGGTLGMGPLDSLHGDFALITKSSK